MSFCAGERVVAHGLATTALNGKAGVVLTFDEAKQRYAVHFDGVMDGVLIRPHHLRQEGGHLCADNEREAPLWRTRDATTGPDVQPSPPSNDTGAEETLEESWARMQRSVEAGRAKRLDVQYMSAATH